MQYLTNLHPQQAANPVNSIHDDDDDDDNSCLFGAGVSYERSNPVDTLIYGGKQNYPFLLVGSRIDLTFPNLPSLQVTDT